ncbi:caspase family protein [Azospirillum sp. B506]|uniref:caspase family protein n=1 Tax=Azospirillum sp. B506 TaxID=137721 RepID=UPI0005B2DAA5|nr:caspase family protein [Azospirillum sp. B506]
MTKTAPPPANPAASRATRRWRRRLGASALTAALLAALPFGGMQRGSALADSGKRVALVIDNGRYSALDSRSDQPAANASAMAAALRSAGFSVTRADNVGRVAMDSALERFREALGGADLGFVYYTGLAVGVGEREFLLPADADPSGADDLPRAALDLDGLLSDLRDSGRRTVVVIDPGVAEALARKVGGGALGTPMEADGLFVVYAHRPGVAPVPPKSGKGPDPFTAALAREMVKPGVTFRDSLAEVARAVAERSEGRQLPWLQDRLGSTLVMVPAVAAAPAKPPATPPNVPPAATAPAREAPPVTTPSLPPGEYEMAKPGVLFDRPAVGARGVAQLATGSVVTVLESVPEGSWLRVRDPSGRTGYLTAGALAARWVDPSPLAARGRGPVEAGPSFGDPGQSQGIDPPAAGTSDPIQTEQPRSFPATPPGTGFSTPDGPAVEAEQQAMRALGDARSAAERARSHPDSRYWSYGFSGGDRYEGSWAQSSSGTNAALGRPVRQGTGVYRFVNGQTYEGEWSGDLMSGFGVMTFTDGSRFAGRFRNGQPDGPGIFHYANGGQSAGQWRGSVRLDE